MAQKAQKWRKTYLLEYRKRSGKTLESVAPQMGITHGQLSKIERGHYPYHQKVLEVAALEYGCTVAEILTTPPEAGSRPKKPKKKA